MIAGRYQPLEHIRPGVPFRARDAATAQTVLLHTITGEASAARRRAQSIARVFHPSLTAIFDVLPEDGAALMLAVEFVTAQPIRRVLAGQPIHPRRAAVLASAIADAVSELHAHGFVHGAISLDSVFLTVKGKAKLDLVSALSAEPAAEVDDLRAIVAVLREMAGRECPELEVSDSAAVLAARLRVLTEPPR